MLLNDSGDVVAAHAWPLPLVLLAQAHGVKVSRNLSVTQDEPAERSLYDDSIQLGGE